jgi:hypothetical protein
MVGFNFEFSRVFGQPFLLRGLGMSTSMAARARADGYTFVTWSENEIH